MLKHILIVDDEKFIRLGLKRMIEQSGNGPYQIAMARNGQEAIEYIKDHPADIVFTDINMPLINGIDLIRHLHKSSNPPVTIIISGYNDFQYAVEGIRNGVVDYLLKPIDDQKIHELLLKYSHWGEENTDIHYMRQSLIQDLRYAAISDEMSERAEQELYQNISRFLGNEQKWLILLRGNSLSLDFNIIEVLQEKFGDQYLWVDHIGKWSMMIIPAFPSFLRESHQGISYWAGTVPLEESSCLYQSCLYAKELAKKGFLLNQPLVTADISFHNFTSSLDVEACISALSMGQLESLRRIIDRNWNEDARKQMNVLHFESQLYSFLQKIQEFYPNIYNRFEEIANQLKDYLSFYNWQAFLREFWGLMYLIADTIKNEGCGKYSPALQAAMDYIELHYMQDINLATVANHVSINYSVLSKEFKEQAGINFVNYLKKRRIEAAKHLLRTTSKNSGQIGRAVGFLNERQYVKVFRDMTGLTPTEFRRLHLCNSTASTNSDDPE